MVRVRESNVTTETEVDVMWGHDQENAGSWKGQENRLCFRDSNLF